MPVETPDRSGAYPCLDDAHIQALAAEGQRHHTQSGEVLIQEGEEQYDFFVVLAGKVADVEGFGGDERVISVHGPGRF
jgi:thioredoxin reductase (NADPH)